MVMVWLFKCMSPCLVKDFLCKFINISYFYQARGNTGGAISLGGDNIMPFIIRWCRNWWDNHLIPYNISVWILKFCSNYLWWVLSCSQNDVRCFQLFHRCFQMFLDVFGVRRMLSRCVQMIANVGRWIFSRSSLDVLWMFSGFFQDVLKGLVSVVGLGGLVPKPLVV